MIQPEELRIGNVIFINDSLRTVEGIVGDQVWFKKEKHLSQDLIINCNPVPLTEDWLRRMGCGKIFKHWETPNKIIFAFGDGCALFLVGPRHINIHYVHNFQNFISLTGTELTIKG